VNRKLVVFVPAESLDAVRDALFAAGAGRIGDYERCSWYTEGTGTFRSLPGASPTVGAVGEEEHVPELRLHTDGGARGNPGPAAFAYVLEADDGTVLAAHGETIGVATNNVAEYRGLVAGLAKAVELGVPEVEVVSDSELLVKQMLGEYKVKNEALRELSLEAARLARKLDSVEYRHVRRAHNELADRLVNEALDAA
jgi:ribonuclease HI